MPAFGLANSLEENSLNAPPQITAGTLLVAHGVNFKVMADGTGTPSSGFIFGEDIEYAFKCLSVNPDVYSGGTSSDSHSEPVDPYGPGDTGDTYVASRTEATGPDPDTIFNSYVISGKGRGRFVNGALNQEEITPFLNGSIEVTINKHTGVVSATGTSALTNMAGNEFGLGRIQTNVQFTNNSVTTEVHYLQKFLDVLGIELKVEQFSQSSVSYNIVTVVRKRPWKKDSNGVKTYIGPWSAWE